MAESFSLPPLALRLFCLQGGAYCSRNKIVHLFKQVSQLHPLLICYIFYHSPIFPPPLRPLPLRTLPPIKTNCSPPPPVKINSTYKKMTFTCRQTQNTLSTYELLHASGEKRSKKNKIPSTYDVVSPFTLASSFWTIEFSSCTPLRPSALLGLASGLEISCVLLRFGRKGIGVEGREDRNYISRS